MPLLGPVLVAHQGAQEGMIAGHDPETVVHLAFESTRAEGQVAQGGYDWNARVEAHDEFVPLVGRRTGEEVHRA